MAEVLKIWAVAKFYHTLMGGGGGHNIIPSSHGGGGRSTKSIFKGMFICLKSIMPLTPFALT